MVYCSSKYENQKNTLKIKKWQKAHFSFSKISRTKNSSDLNRAVFLIKGHLSSKVNFHQTLSSIKGCPPLNGYLPFDQKIFLNSIFPCTWVFPRCKKNFILLVPHFFPNFAPPSAKRLPNRQFEIQRAGRGSLDEKKSYKIFPIF